MTHSELRWAQSQSWWNDFTNLYGRSTWASEINIVDYLNEQPLEMVAMRLINDENFNDTDNQILVRIANACLNHMEDLPGLGKYSKPVIRTYKKEEKPSVRQFSYTSEKEEVAVVNTDNILLVAEKESLYKELKLRGVEWDSVEDKEKRLIFFKTTKVLGEI